MPLFRLTADKSIYQELKDQGIKPSKQAQDQKNLVVTPVTTAKSDTVIEVGNYKYNLFDDVNKTTVIAFALAAPIAGVAKKGEYIGIANLEPYEPAPPLEPGRWGEPKKWQLLVDNLNVRKEDTLSSKVIGKLKKGKVYTLRPVVGSEPMHYCVEAKGFVALADPNSKKFFWNLVAASGEVIDLNKLPDKAKPPITPTKKASTDYGLTPAKPSTPANYAAEGDTGGLSTQTILMIAGGVVLALLFLLPPSKGKKK